MKQKCQISKSISRRMLRQQSSTRKDRGAVLIITALLIVALMLLVARAIDLSIAESSKTKSQGITSAAALASLERYYQSRKIEFKNPPCTTYLCQIIEARIRAQNIINNAYNDIVGENNPFAPVPTNIHLLLPYESPPNCGQTPTTKCVDGIVRPGSWWFSEPVGGCGAYAGTNWTPPSGGLACPCDAGTWNGECFQQITVTDGSQVANAFQIEYWGSWQRGMKTFFANVGGFDKLSIDSKSTATIVPKHGIALLDLSGSSETSNFVRNSGPAPGAYNTARSSFQLDTAINSCAGLPANNPCPLEGSCAFKNATEQTIYNNPDCSPGIAGNQPCIPHNRAAPPVPPFSLPLLATEHAKDDYSCKAISYQVCATCDFVAGAESCATCGANSSDSYVVDKYRSASYKGAEPMNPIVDGIFEMTNIYEQRAVSNDRMGAFFFDSTANIVASDHPNPATLLRRYPLTEINSPIFNELQEATDDTTGYPQNRIDHFLFPRREHDGTGVYTNFPEILTQAFNQLSSVIGSETADQFVILFSDGGTNCDPDRIPPCANAPAWYIDSISETGLSLAPYGSAKIAFHLALFGNFAGPHNIVRRTMQPGSSACMDEFEARSLGLSTYPWVDPGAGTVQEWIDWNETMNNGNPSVPPQYHWSWPLNLQSWADYTNGFYQPVRDNCQTGVDTSAYVNSLCAGLTAGSAYAGNPHTPPGWTYSAANGPAIGNNGELYCEQTARTKKQIVSDMIKDIFNRNPYILRTSGNLGEY